MLLTDDEISRALRDEGYTDEVHAELEVVAKAQLKEVVERLYEPCDEHPGKWWHRKDCEFCWNSLLKEVENV